MVGNADSVGSPLKPVSREDWHSPVAVPQAWCPHVCAVALTMAGRPLHLRQKAFQV